MCVRQRHRTALELIGSTSVSRDVDPSQRGQPSTVLSNPREPLRKTCKCCRVCNRRQEDMHCNEKSKRQGKGQSDLAPSPLEQKKYRQYYFHCDQCEVERRCESRNAGDVEY